MIGRLRCVALLCFSGMAACGADDTCPEPASPRAYFDPTLGELDHPARSWLAYPFPADHRKRDSGTIDLRDFPNPEHLGDLQTYVHYATNNLSGFGTNSPVYVAFDVPLATDDIPTGLTDHLESDAPLQIVDVDPDSPEYGKRRPLRAQYFAKDGNYVAANSLAVAPRWGFPLRQSTTYAFVMTDAIRDARGRKLQAPPALTRLLGGKVPASCVDLPDQTVDLLTEQFAPLGQLLDEEGLDPARVVAATVFTTQEITEELATLRQTVQAIPAPELVVGGWQELPQAGSGSYYQPLSFRWSSAGDTVAFYELEGRYRAPNFQTGSPPYAQNDGEFNFVDGKPEPTRTETLRFVLTIPASPPPDGESCWPIVQYAHGTGGSAGGFARKTGGRLAARGLAGIGIDQPLHGRRWSGSSSSDLVAFYSFNLFNLDASRTLFRQSAVDTFSLTRFVRESLVVTEFASPTGEEICFDPARVYFFGHSHGGLSGALAAAFENDIKGWVLSGSGGGLSITIMERSDAYVDPEALLREILRPQEDEELSELHPIVGLLQLLVEITDPINYSPFWIDQAGYSAPQPLLVTSGLDDAATPHRTATAMALAGRVPVLLPVPLEIPAYEVAGLPPVQAPVSANLRDVTAGFIQWGVGAGHHVIFRTPEAINASMRFLQSAAYGEGAVIERDPGSNAR